MEVNSLKSKNSYHNYVAIKQSDNSSPIELILCGADGAIESNLNTTCTVTLLDVSDNEVRHKSTENIVGGILSFYVTNDLKSHTHNLEITLSDGKKYPADGRFDVYVSPTHEKVQLNIIEKFTLDEAYNLLANNLVGEKVDDRFKELSVDVQQMGEVIIARGESPSLDIELNRIEEKAEKELSALKKYQLLSSFKRYGIIDKSLLPFNLGFNLYRGTDGRITHDYVFSQHTQGAVNIYVNRQYGLDSNDGLSKDKPVAYLKTALDIAHTRPENKVNIVFLEKMVYYNLYESGSSNNTYNISKNINLLSDHEDGSYIYTGNFPNNYTWINDAGVYKTTRSAVAEVFDSKFKDFRGNPKKLIKVDSLAECKSRLNSYYTDNVSVWVHRQDNSNPADDNAVMLLLPINTAFVFNLSNCILFIDNVHFYTKQASAASNALSVNGDSTSDIIIRRSNFCYSRNNGLAAKTFNRLYLFDSYSEGVGADAFNYHANAVSANPNEKVFLYNCYGHNAGALSNNNGNIFTAHDGMKVIGVNLIGHDSIGPVLADVNGCESIYFDCVMYNSLASEGATKSAFYADESQALKKGSFTLVSCSGGGDDTFGVNSDGLIIPKLQNFKGVPGNINKVEIL
ncbi:hypothetical protein [Macrococcus armenti]|uniref:hypothetical protein n=1 Tax=Macrococcus armenti TaxID=2875764 RepID=UPI001CCFF2D1|nr:hypothetical protein [Macrococcus armenti]UBH14166.1 hypothetical protein LAU43_05575 [Macrococcus armenti]